MDGEKCSSGARKICLRLFFIYNIDANAIQEFKFNLPILIIFYTNMRRYMSTASFQKCAYFI